MGRPKSVNYTRAREIIRALNKAHSDVVKYKIVEKQINELFPFHPIRGVTLGRDTMLYRGRVMLNRPTRISEMGPPPPEVVAGYQRCNSPANPMFYASTTMGSVFTEIDVGRGDDVYLSRWIAPKGLLFVEVFGESEGHPSPKYSMIQAFIETKFSSRIHSTFANDYKVTSAISEFLLSKNLKSEGLVQNTLVPVIGEGLGSIVFPSVQAIGSAPNFAIKPSYAMRHLVFDGVEKIRVTSAKEQSYQIDRIDFARLGADGETLDWQGNPLSWTIENGTHATVGVEGDNWVVRSATGKILGATLLK